MRVVSCTLYFPLPDASDLIARIVHLSVARIAGMAWGKRYEDRNRRQRLVNWSGPVVQSLLC